MLSVFSESQKTLLRLSEPRLQIISPVFYYKIHTNNKKTHVNVAPKNRYSLHLM